MFWIPSQLEGAYVGQDVTIECHSEAFPDSINYWIKKDGVMLLLSKLFKCRTVRCDLNYYLLDQTRLSKITISCFYHRNI